MADEERKILLEIKSNLDQASKDAADYGAKIRELQGDIKKLDKDDENYNQTLEEKKTELREVQKQYRESTKTIDDLTRANKAQAGSYEELQAQLRLAEKDLKQQAGLLTKNADGTIQLSEGYMEASQKVENARGAVNEFNLGINQGNTNVGLYQQSIQKALGSVNLFGMNIGGLANQFKSTLPSGLKQSEKGVKSFQKAFMASGIGALILLIVAAIAALKKGWESFTSRYDEWGERIQSRSAGMSMAFDYMVDGVVDGLRKMGEWFQDWEKHWESILEKATMVMGKVREAIMNPMESLNKLEEFTDKTFESMTNAGGRFVKFLKGAVDDPRGAFETIKGKVGDVYTGVKEWVEPLKDAAKNVREVYQRAVELSNQMIALEKEQRAFAVESARVNLEIKKLEATYRDVRKTDEERLEAARKAMTLEIARANEENRLAEEKLRIIVAQNSLAKSGDKDLQRQQEAEKELLSIQQRSYETRLRVQRQLASLEEGIRKKAIQDQIRDMKAGIELAKLTGETKLDDLKRYLEMERDLQLMNEDLTANEKKLIHQQYLAGLEALDNEQRLKDIQEKERRVYLEELKWEEVQMVTEKHGKQNEVILQSQYDSARSILQRYQELALQDTELNETEREILIQEFRLQELQLEQEFNDKKQYLSDMRVAMMREEIAAVGTALGGMAQLFGQQTQAGKMFAAAQATINTYLAASQVLASPTLGPVGKTLAMIGIIASGLANVRKILSVDASGRSAPSSGRGGGVATRAGGAIAGSKDTLSNIGASIGTKSQPTGTQTTEGNNELIEAIKGMPAPKLVITEFDDMRNRMKKVETKATF